MTDEVVEPTRTITPPAGDEPAPVEEIVETEETSDETQEASSETAEESEAPTEESSEEVSDEDQSEATKIRFSDIKKKYPDLLKEYPDLRKNYFLAEQYGEHFPTIADAEEAKGKAATLDKFNVEVTDGNFENVILAVGQANPRALEKVADNILPQLYKQDPQLYFRASKQAISHMLGAAIRRAESSKDENLKASAQNIAVFALGNQDPNAIQRTIQNQPDPEKEALRNQLNEIQGSAALNYQQGVYEEAEKAFTSEVMQGLDPKNEMNDAMKDYAKEKIIDDVVKSLSADRRFQAEMNSLWNRAAQTGFSVEIKAKLRNAFLARARTLLPAIRAKRRSEALGTAPRAVIGKTNVPASAGITRTPSAKLTKDVIREKRMSPMDIIMHGVK